MKTFKDEEGYWFLSWVVMRRKKKLLEVEIGKLKSEIDHLNHLLSEKASKERELLIKKFNNEQRRTNRIYKKLPRRR